MYGMGHTRGLPTALSIRIRWINKIKKTFHWLISVYGVEVLPWQCSHCLNSFYCWRPWRDRFRSFVFITPKSKLVYNYTIWTSRASSLESPSFSLTEIYTMLLCVPVLWQKAEVSRDQKQTRESTTSLWTYIQTPPTVPRSSAIWSHKAVRAGWKISCDCCNFAHKILCAGRTLSTSLITDDFGSSGRF